ncbi:macro domain-containing protein [Akkermansia muciniphila]|uniref:macro domain-containing protein n=1 Tax=Akkermansia muciniphila TaxID=239935 RepID=UPI0033A46E66
MIIRKLLNKSLWIDSFTVAISIVAAIETIAAISGLSLEDFDDSISWGIKLIIIAGTLFLICFIVGITKGLINSKNLKIKIRNIDVTITTGDLFKTNGWRVIPFNEYYDTKVDDIVIAKKSLNGIFLNQYVSDISNVEQEIESYVGVLKSRTKHNRVCYPLGNIIPYVENEDNRYMLLALTHFDKNEARITHEEYESCLITMWKEISRAYAYYPISLPLIGGGITRIAGNSDKNEEQLLRCILCTLKYSDTQIGKPVTIVLTEDTIRKIDLYNIKKHF